MLRSLRSKKTVLLSVTLPLLLIAGMATSAQGATLVLYPFSADLNPTVVGAGVTPTLNLSNLNGNTAVADDGFGNVLQAYPSNGSTDAATAVTNLSFFSLTLSITPGTFGQELLQFNVGKGGDADPRGYFIRSSLDGYTADLLSQTLPAGAQQAPAPQSLALNWTGQTSVTLRFYVWTPDPVGNSVDFSNLQISDVVSGVPEPGTAAVVMVGALAMLAAARRRNRNA